MTWVAVGTREQIPERGARVLRIDGRSVALFRTGDGGIFALEDRCPHRGGPLSQGIVHGRCVTCPLHEWIIELETGRAAAPDEGATARFDVKVEHGVVLIDWPPPAEAGDALPDERPTALAASP